MENKKSSLNNRQIIKQKIELTHAQTPLSSAEIDLILTLIAQIKHEDEEFKDFEFTKSELETLMGKKLNGKQLQELAVGLLKKPLLLPVDGLLDADNWRAANWFSYFLYKDGVITCAFNPPLAPYLLQIQGRYSLGSLKALLPMKSKYSKELYMILSSEAYRGNYIVEIEKLQKKLQVPKSLLQYNQFKTKVLLQAQKDMDKFSDVTFTFEEHKKIKKKVVELKFHIKRNLNSLKQFIKTIRELYVNVPLAKTEHGLLQCSEKGELYFKENPHQEINAKQSNKLWKDLHEIRDKLVCFKQDGDEEEERL